MVGTCCSRPAVHAWRSVIGPVRTFWIAKHNLTEKKTVSFQCHIQRTCGIGTTKEWGIVNAVTSRISCINAKFIEPRHKAEVQMLWSSIQKINYWTEILVWITIKSVATLLISVTIVSRGPQADPLLLCVFECVCVYVCIHTYTHTHSNTHSNKGSACGPLLTIVTDINRVATDFIVIQTRISVQ
jgi:hypothetical protein